MSSNDKYRMFKEFMHNELGITKEDIRTWVKESAQEEARKIVSQACGSFDVKREIRNLLTERYSEFRRDLLSSCADAVLKQITIAVKDE